MEPKIVSKSMKNAENNALQTYLKILATTIRNNNKFQKRMCTKHCKYPYETNVSLLARNVTKPSKHVQNTLPKSIKNHQKVDPKTFPKQCYKKVFQKISQNVIPKAPQGPQNGV